MRRGADKAGCCNLSRRRQASCRRRVLVFRSGSFFSRLATSIYWRRYDQSEGSHGSHVATSNSCLGQESNRHTGWRDDCLSLWSTHERAARAVDEGWNALLDQIRADARTLDTGVSSQKTAVGSLGHCMISAGLESNRYMDNNQIQLAIV